MSDSIEPYGGRQEVALFRFEGTLSPRPTLTAAAWMSLNARHVRARLLSLSGLALAAPLALRDPTRATRLAWSSLEGMSEDRLVVLGQLYADDHLMPALSPVGLSLLERCRERGQRLVLLSDNIDVIMKPVARHLGFDEVICNALSLDAHDRVTGDLRPPVFGRELGGKVLKDQLQERGVALGDACAYGSSAGDSVLLSAVALPCAVTPDRELRRLARDLDWPVVEG